MVDGVGVAATAGQRRSQIALGFEVIGQEPARFRIVRNRFLDPSPARQRKSEVLCASA